MLEVLLRPSFRYVHEPLPPDEDALPWLGDEAIGEELRTRLSHSKGGAFLISGFRGVGKSTIVNRVLDQMKTEISDGDIVLPIVLRVARSMDAEQLLFAVVRRVFEKLTELAVLDRLSAETKHALLVAYMRTSLSYKETHSESKERSAGLNLDPGKGAASLVNFALPKLTMSAKRSRALATEAAFLAYSETDAEYDLMRILELVGSEKLAPLLPRPRRRLNRRRHSRASPHGPGRVRLVIVLDEVDKLTVTKGGLDDFERLLGDIKNVLTMSDAHFLVVAGPDVHDHAVRDAGRGNGVYESVFGWRIYAPCMWDAADQLISNVVRLEALGNVSTDVGLKKLEPFTDYLRFKARGVPRRLLQEFNSFVTWRDGVPVLVIKDDDMNRLRFYSKLEGIMRDYFERNGQPRLFPVPIDEDRRRLGGYYIVDWVLQSDGKPFSAADLIHDGDDPEFDPMLRLSHGRVERLLDHLAKEEILEVVWEANTRRTIFQDVGDSAAKVYKLAEDIRMELFGFAVRYESERLSQDLSIFSSLSGAVPAFPPFHERAEPAGSELDRTEFAGATPPLRPPPIEIVNDRYELSRLLGQGGMGSVYSGTDLVTGQPVAVKVLRSFLAGNSQARARAHREAEVTRRLAHSQIVRTIDVADDTDGNPVLVMELLDGITLADRVHERGPMRPRQAVAMGILLADALAYLAREKIVRIDLKPSNIIIQPDRGPVIIDLGVARDLEASELTNPRGIVGTPIYMAPELLSGETPDRRADIYSLGLVLYYALVGRNPWEDLDGLNAVMFTIVHQQIKLSGLPASGGLRHVIARATERDPRDRYQDAAEMFTALMSIPEWDREWDPVAELQDLAATRLDFR